MTDFEKEKTFALTIAGILVTMFSALISAVSSAIILNIIRLSPQKLSTTHHRIMALMSLFDLISSVSMALVTLPMPTDNRITFSGPMLGNLQTCQAQGYLFSLGNGGSGGIFACLSWYYVLQINFHLDSDKMKRIVEPIMYVYSILVALVVPSYFLAHDMLGPDLHFTFCTITYYIGPDKVWDERDTYRFHHVYKAAIDVGASIIFLHFALIFVAMIIIICTIYRSTKDLMAITKQRFEQTKTHDDDNHYQATLNSLHNLTQTRGVLVQALMYILSYILTWMFLLMFYINYEYYMDIGVAVLFPLQGFWNMIIFVYDKAHLMRGAEERVSFWEAVKSVICSPSQTPGVILTSFSPAILERTEHHMIEDVECQNEKESPTNSKVFDAYDELSLIKDNSVADHPSDESSSIDFDGLFEIDHSLESRSISRLTSNFKNKHHDDSEVEYLGEGNVRFYIGKNGLRRTGRLEDTRRTQFNPQDPNTCMDSPSSVLYGGSENSYSLGGSITRKLYFLHDIKEDEDGSSNST